MADNNRDKVIQLSIDHIHDQIKSVNVSVQRLADNQAAMNEVLIRNTIIVDEHKKRSESLETWTQALEDRMVANSNIMNSVDFEVKRIDNDLDPIKKHVEKVNRIVNFIGGIPIVLKVTIGILTIVSSMYGISIFLQTVYKLK